MSSTYPILNEKPVNQGKHKYIGKKQVANYHNVGFSFYIIIEEVK
jgi:hypothetical protein